MSGGGGGHGVMSSIMNGLQMAAGIGSEVIMPGNPMGVGMTMNGLNGFMGGGGSGASTGFAAPGTSGTPSTADMAASGALPSWINPSQIAGVSTSMGTPNPPGGTNWLSMLGGSNGIANMLGGAASAAGTVAKNQPGAPQQVQSYAPTFRGGGGQIPSLGAGQSIASSFINNPIQPPQYRLLSALGFQG